MKKLKQIIAVLVIGTLLFTACDNRDEVEGTESPLPPCGFTFTSAELGSGSANIDILDYDIDFVIAMSGECSTDYEMKYEVIDYTGSVVYRHEGDVKTEDTFFTIVNGNFSDHIKVTGYDEAFSIKFTVRNTGSQVTPQTKIINFNFAAFSITTPADVSVYAKQTATYTSTLSGGGPGTTYTVKVEKIDGDDVGVTALMINGASATINTDTSINITGTELIVKLTPTLAHGEDFTAGNGNTETPIAENYKVTVTKNNVEKATENFNLESKRPGFGIDLGLSPESIDASNEETSNLTVGIDLLDGYDQDLTYTYDIAGLVFIDNISGQLIRANVESNMDNTPDTQTFVIKSLLTTIGTSVNVTLTIKVTNEYNYIVEETRDIIITP